MIEILIIIAVVRAFARKAEEKNLSKNLWGFIGAASYYVPILLTSFLILPGLALSGFIEVTDETAFTVMAIFVNIIVGVSCCLVAYQILKNQKTREPEAAKDILDHGLS